MIQLKADLEKHAIIGDACPDLRMKYDVDIREFVILACLQENGSLDRPTLSRVSGLSLTSTNVCLQRLRENGLACIDRNHPTRITPSSEGLALLRQAGHVAQYQRAPSVQDYVQPALARPPRRRSKSRRGFVSKLGRKGTKLVPCLRQFDSHMVFRYSY